MNPSGENWKACQGWEWLISLTLGAWPELCSTTPCHDSRQPVILKVQRPGGSVKRCERRLGELIREGQAAGEIRKPGYNQHAEEDPAGDPLPLSAKTDIFDNLHRAQTETYAMTDDVTAEQFKEGEPASPAMPYGPK